MQAYENLRFTDPDLLTDPQQDLAKKLRTLVTQRTADLPILPATATEALRLVKRPDVRLEEILEIIEQDPPLAARILGVANSSFYARGAQITSLRNAIVRLGMHALRDAIYMAVYANTIFDTPGYVDLVRDVFEHSVAVARIARGFAHHVRLDEETAFLAGLLHDVGEARCYKLLAKMPEARRTPRDELKSVAMELHTLAGAALARSWNLPHEVAVACERHHDPDGSPAAELISAADALAHYLEPTPTATRKDVEVALARLAIEGPELELAIHRAKEELTLRESAPP